MCLCLDIGFTRFCLENLKFGCVIGNVIRGMVLQFFMFKTFKQTVALMIRENLIRLSLLMTLNVGYSGVFLRAIPEMMLSLRSLIDLANLVKE